MRRAAASRPPAANQFDDFDRSTPLCPTSLFFRRFLDRGASILIRRNFFGEWTGAYGEWLGKKEDIYPARGILTKWEQKIIAWSKCGGVIIVI